MKKTVCGMRSREQEKARKDMRGIGQTDRQTEQDEVSYGKREWKNLIQNMQQKQRSVYSYVEQYDKQSSSVFPNEESGI